MTRTDLATLDDLPTGVITSCRKTADETFSSTSYADSTGMSLAVAANKFYKFRFVVLYNTNATSVGIKLAIIGPASSFAFAGCIGSSSAGSVSATATVHSTVAAGDSSVDLPLFTPATGPGAATACVIIEGVIDTGATAGNLKLRHASETATNTTIVQHSHGELFEVA